MITALSAPNTSPSPLLPGVFLALPDNRPKATWPVHDSTEENNHLSTFLPYARDIIVTEVNLPAASARGP